MDNIASLLVIVRVGISHSFHLPVGGEEGHQPPSLPESWIIRGELYLGAALIESECGSGCYDFIHGASRLIHPFSRPPPRSLSVPSL